ncbi:MAG: hypothetical protein RJA70_5029, partial [Pseudomonadota bacterium]
PPHFQNGADALTPGLKTRVGSYNGSAGLHDVDPAAIWWCADRRARHEH